MRRSPCILSPLVTCMLTAGCGGPPAAASFPADGLAFEPLWNGRNLDGWVSIDDDTREPLFRHLREQIARRDANGACWSFLTLHGFA